MLGTARTGGIYALAMPCSLLAEYTVETKRNQALRQTAAFNGKLRAYWSAPMRDTDHPYASTLGLVLASFVARLGLEPWLGERSPFLLFTVAIVIAAGRYGFKPGLLAMIGSLAFGTIIFIAPSDFTALTVDQLANLGAFLVTGAAMLIFAGHLRGARERAERLQVELQHAQTVTGMGTMAATLAHELNQPLAAGSNYLAACKALIRSLDSNRKSAIIKSIDEAQGQIVRASEIIRHARDLVTNASARPVPASLTEIISRVRKSLMITSEGPSLQASLSIEPDADTLFVNPVQIEQVFLNLLRNAAHASQSAGVTSAVKITAVAKGDMSRIEVSDNGPGIDSERLNQLFWAAAKPSASGLGLGLSISRSIIDAHGGSIVAHNGAHGGATFVVTLPRQIQEASKPAKKSAA